ncbi:hypothetical protein FRC06_009017 [Ceratobasidium sp. 370]|nr:hypothetical protein FRC06_009017 [Ceratobasidium sp. 370]
MSVFPPRHSPSPNAFKEHCSGGADLTRTKSEPVLSRLQSSPEKKWEAWVQQIEDFAGQLDVSTAELESVSLKDVEELQQEFQTRGIKFRFDWDAGSNTACLRMPKSMHSTTLGAWVNRISPEVEARLREIARCGKPTLWYTGDSRCRLVDGSTREPDTGFLVYDDQPSIPPNAIPRVIFEFALTQSLDDVLFKAWTYLFASEDPYAVHAVVVCNVENPVTATSTGTCRLTVDVWVRKATGDMDVDFPMDGCVPTLEADEEALTPVASPPWCAAIKAALDSRGRNLRQAMKSDASGRVRSISGVNGEMWRRNKEQIVVYDESLGDQQGSLPPLRMDAYDFLRVCQARPDDLISDEDRHVHIDLEPLRTVFAVLVRGEREAQCGAGRGRKKGARPAEEEAQGAVRKRPRAVPRSYELLEE